MQKLHFFLIKEINNTNDDNSKDNICDDNKIAVKFKNISLIIYNIYN